MDQLIRGGEGLATTDVVIMEVLAGARSDDERVDLQRILYRCEFLMLEGLADYEAAADLYRNCRQGGETPRKMTDCLIAVVAIRHGVELLHCDDDFDVIARHSSLRLSLTD